MDSLGSDTTIILQWRAARTLEMRRMTCATSLLFRKPQQGATSQHFCGTAPCRNTERGDAVVKRSHGVRKRLLRDSIAEGFEDGTSQE